MYNTLKNKVAHLFLLTVMAMLVSLNASAQLDISLTTEPVDIIKIQDLLKLAPGNSTGSSRVLFKVEFTNPGSTDIEIAPRAMEFTLGYNGTDIITLRNKAAFSLKPGKTILNSNTIVNSRLIGFELKTDVPDIELLKKKFGIKEISIGSPVPSGSYDFTISYGDIVKTSSINLTNIERNVVILGPGEEFGSGDVPELDDRQPTISWSGGAPNFTVVVVEKSPTENSLGDLLSKTPNLKATTSSFSLKYPASGTDVRPLIPGKTYVVAVASLVKDFSSTSDQIKWSTPFVFKIKEQQTGAESASNQLVDALRRISGSQYDAAFDQLANAKPTGKLFLDDQPIGVNDLKDIMGKIQSQTYSLKSISIK